jgi:carbon storage regulator
MLVLSRKKHESIVIDENIVITVVDIKGGGVRLGVQAPKEVTIHRREVFEAIKRSEGSEDAPAEGTESGK